MIHYFKKELVSNTLRDRKGEVVPFEELGGNTGVIALNSETHADLIADLIAVKGTRGVSIIDQAVYEWLKKNRPRTDSAPSSLPPNGMPALRVLQRQVADASHAVKDDPSQREIPQQPAVEKKPVAPAAKPTAPGSAKSADLTPAPVPPAKPPPNLGVPKPAPAQATA